MRRRRESLSMARAAQAAAQPIERAVVVDIGKAAQASRQLVLVDRLGPGIEAVADIDKMRGAETIIVFPVLAEQKQSRGMCGMIAGNGRQGGEEDAGLCEMRGGAMVLVPAAVP